MHLDRSSEERLRDFHRAKKGYGTFIFSFLLSLHRGIVKTVGWVWSLSRSAARCIYPSKVPGSLTKSENGGNGLVI